MVITPLTPPAPDLNELGIHHDFISTVAAETLSLLPIQLTQQLSTHALQLPAWYTHAPQSQRQALKVTQALNHQSLQALQVVLNRIGTVESFAVPLLEQALLKEFGIACDVKNNIISITTLNPYTDEIERTDSQTLLQAALHNFEENQAEPGGIPRGSYLWNYKSTRSSDPLPRTIAIEPTAFASLCRRLDIGERYQQHLTTIFNPTSSTEKVKLDQLFIQHERHALILQADIALMKKDILASTHAALINYCKGHGDALFNGHTLTFESMALDTINFNSLIIAHAPTLEEDPRCIVYIPGDPISCIKEYASLREAAADFKEKIKLDSYREFFIHLAPQSQKLELKKRLDSRIQDLSRDPLYLQPAAINTNLFQHLYEHKTRQLQADARFLAVPTAQINRLSLINRLEHYLDTTLNILNVEALFVPGLGEVMMVVFAAQMVSEIFHGIEAWERSEKDLAWAYTKDVLLNLAFTAAAGRFAAELARPAPVEVSPFIEELDLIELPDGKKQLWKPDLTPFEQDIPLAPLAKPDAAGLHTHNGQSYVPLEGKYYRVQKSPGNAYRLPHPTDSAHYAPHIAANGHGAWVHEAEELAHWSDSTFVRRLDPALSALTDEQTHALLHASDTDVAVLRRTFSELEPPPALLADAINRFKINQDLDTFIRKMLTNDVSADPLLQLQLLVDVELWPRSKALRCLDSEGRTIIEYGNGGTIKVPVIQVLDSQIQRGELLENVLRALDINEVQALTGGAFEDSLAQKTQKLSVKIARHAEQRRDELFKSHYAKANRSSDPLIRQLTTTWPTLPMPAARELIGAASSAERLALQEGAGIPLRLAEEARLLVEQTRLSHACDGLFFNYGITADTQKMLLHNLERLPGWPTNTRIEIREHTLGGTLLDHLGSTDAPIRKVLVKQGSRYQTYNGHDQMLHGLDDIYASVLHALQDQERSVLGFPHTGQGQALKEALVQQPPISRKALRTLLRMPASKSRPFSPLRLAHGREGYPAFASNPVLCTRLPIGCLQSRPRRVRYLLQKLFPMHHPQVVEDLLGLEELNSRVGLARLEALNLEYKTQISSLSEWIAEPLELVRISDEHSRPVHIRDKERVAQKLMKCWRRAIEGGQLSVDYSLDLSGFNLGRLPSLTADFSHVTSLHMSNVYLDSSIDKFLTHFANLKVLKFESAYLRQLPESLFSLQKLKYLYLGNNRFRLTPQVAARLSGMTQLNVIDLSRNTLTTVPDFTRLNQLHSLNLRDTGLTHWPAGVENLPLLTTLDLRENAITALPESFYAIPRERLARIWLHDNPLDAGTVERIDELRERLGLPPEVRLHNPASANPVNHWLNADMPAEQRAEMSRLWHELQATPGHEAFFRVINDLVASADFARDRVVLTAKVWRILEAARDFDFREELFIGATQHDNCVDRASTVFSRFGFKLLLREAEALEGAAKETELLKLMKGRVRLLELDDIARSQFDLQTQAYNEALANPELTPAQRSRLKPDLLEVQLIYQVDLGLRLNLPWQPTHMQFRAQALTSPQQIEAAYEIVINNEAKDGFLAKKLVQEGTWRDYLESVYSEEILRNNTPHEQRHEDIETLQEKQQEWADTLNSHDSVAREHLQGELKTLARTLKIDEQQIFTGQPMTEADYHQELVQIESRKRRTLELITQGILDRKALTSISDQ